jgi:transposase-like protein
VPSATLESWIRLAGRREIDPDGTMPEEQLREIQRLQRENARLQREVDFLKKADAFFRELDQRKKDLR